MRYLILLLATVMIGLAIGCGKSNPAAKGGNTDSTTNGGGSNGGSGGTKGGLAFAGYEYQGFMTELSREWEKPILIHFNADSTVVDFCYFILNAAALEPDSLTGKILSIGTASGGGPSVTVYFKDIADTQVYNFSPDLSGLSGGSSGLAANQFYFSGLTRDTKQAASLLGTFWTCDSSTEQNSTFGDPWYPDINGTAFTPSEGVPVTEFLRNGIVPHTGYNNDSLVKFQYLQVGNRVYFYGYNENNGLGIGYFGIISDDGNTINADTRNFAQGRVPVYQQTFDYYGEAGNPPIMHKGVNP